MGFDATTKAGTLHSGDALIKMSDMTNYSTYHLEELKKVLSDIDESKNPEEAKIIREYIEKGGYSYPPNTVTDSVVFVSAIYKWSLVFILSVLLVFNLYIFIVLQSMLSLLPVAIQASLLYMVFSNHRHARTLIKIWSIFVLISALFGFLSMYFAPGVIVGRLLNNLFSLFIGLSYLIFADRSVHLVSNNCNK